MKKEEIDKLTFFVLRGKNKREVFSILKDEPHVTQAEIFHKTDMYRTHVGRTMRTLEDKDIIKCINPKERTYKLYELTSKGKKVAENFEKYSKEKK